MNSLLQIALALATLSLVESTDITKSLDTYKAFRRSLCNNSCRNKIRLPMVCGSDGKTYYGLCELVRARCRSKTNIGIIKVGKCPTCPQKGPVQCFVPACFRPSCPAYPKAICVSFCACQSEYFYQGRKVNCHKTTQTSPCDSKYCGPSSKCKVVNGKAVCVSRGAVCSLPKVVGPCKAKFLQFYFNSRTQKCEPFYYGGCRGNGNNFKTKELCENTCKHDQDPCSLSPVQGPCRARIRRYFYNMTSSKCETFFYGGCRGNKNNFLNIKECEKNCKRAGNPCDLVVCGVKGRCKVVNGKPVCISSDPCSLPPAQGLCEAHMPRYFYNVTSSKCERFFYGGCGGNKNNFLNIKECEKNCKLGGNPCDLVYCGVKGTCKVMNGKPVCISSVLPNPCIATLCRVGTRCIVVNGKGLCIRIKPTVNSLCAAVLCPQGTKCFVRNKRATCVKPCWSNRQCNQQGSVCSLKYGICQCTKYCLAIHRPVCGSDSRRYSNKCHLDAAACRKKTTIRTVPCHG